MLDVLGKVYRNRGLPLVARKGEDQTLRTTARLVSVDSSAYTATISLWGGEPIPGVPCTPATYTGVTAVHVLLTGGRPVMVTGPATTAANAAAMPQARASEVVSVRNRVVSPVWSGTYRVSRSAWDRWNTSTYGGRSDVYQAGSSSSGTLYGFAGYGSQVVALGASKITKASLSLVSNGAGFLSSWTATVQGSESGTQPPGQPTVTGDTFTVTVGGYGKAGQVASVDIPSDVSEGFRTGALRGFVLVGADYGGTFGTGHPLGWVFTVDYEVTA